MNENLSPHVLHATMCLSDSHTGSFNSKNCRWRWWRLERVRVSGATGWFDTRDGTTGVVGLGTARVWACWFGGKLGCKTPYRLKAVSPDHPHAAGALQKDPAERTVSCECERHARPLPCRRIHARVKSVGGWVHPTAPASWVYGRGRECTLQNVMNSSTRSNQPTRDVTWVTGNTSQKKVVTTPLQVKW